MFLDDVAHIGHTRITELYGTSVKEAVELVGFGKISINNIKENTANSSFHIYRERWVDIYIYIQVWYKLEMLQIN